MIQLMHWLSHLHTLLQKNMLDVFKYAGFILIFLRFVAWVGSSITIKEKKWQRVLLAQITEGLLVVFFYVQLFGKENILPMHSAPAQYVGFFLTYIGVGLAYLAKQQLGKAWVYADAYRIVPHQPLITTGVYKIVRHPIYTGIVVSYMGIELLAGSWIWISALFFLIPFYRQAKREEKLLEEHFGEAYKKYKLRTKMLIPFVL